jgi:O-antigen/teichoic acid export membrane protein
VVGFVTSLSLWIIGKWKPLLVFSKQSFKELFGFGGFMLLSNIVYSFTNNIQTLVMGKLFNPAVLGNYTQARQLRNVASDSISSVISQVLYPDFANNQTDDKGLLYKLNFSVQIISYFVIALMLICILVADPLIKTLYGEKWVVCIPYFKVLCIAGLFVALQDVNLNIIAAKGKSKLLFFFNLGKLIVFVVFMVVGARIGDVFGLIWGINLYVFVAWLVFAYISTSLLHSSIWSQIKLVLENIILAILPFLVTFLINKVLPITFSNITSLLLSSICFILLYIGISFVTKNKVFLYVIEKLINNKHANK